MRMLLLIPVLAVVGCESTQCKVGEVASVTVSVFDAAGDPLAADDVTYTVDGEPGGACDPLDAEGTEFTCGLEEPGTFVITVAAGGGSVEETIDVGMAADGCHVQGEFVDVTAG
ncbi:MAG: hypothetical protein ACI9K2_002652 [Myxococcota bacterium]|jgi:hypothetical protein